MPVPKVQISEALKIIDPTPARLNKCRKDIEKARDLLSEYEAEFNYDDATTPTRQTKREARKLAKALQRVLYVVASSKPVIWRANFPTNVLKHYVALCNEHASMAAPRRTDSQPELMIAVQLAADLLVAHRRELTGGFKGDLNRLVSVLLGHAATKDHTFVCRKVLAERAKRRRKLRAKK
jgi:hypothetical protein